MADRYWVGGAGTWNNAATTNWSTSSGGASGASVPTTADSVFFDANSGTTPFTVTVSTNSNASCQNMTVSAGNITFGSGNASFNHIINGNLDIHSLTTWTSTSEVLLRTTSTQTTQINSNGVVVGGRVTFFANSSGTINLASNLAVTGSNNILLNSNGGSFEGNGFWLTTAANVTTSGSVAGTYNNLRTTSNYIFSGTATATLAATAEIPDFLYSSGNNLTFATGSNITIGNNFRITSTTARTFTMQANSRVYLGASATSGSNIFVSNAAGNLTLSRGDNTAIVLAFGGSSGQFVNLYAFGSGYSASANNLNFTIPNGSYRIDVYESWRGFDIDFTGFSGTANLRGPLRPAGNLILSNTMTILGDAANNIRQSGGTTELTTNGLLIPVPIDVSNAIVFKDNVTLTTNNVTLGNINFGNAATCNFNGYDLTCSRFGVDTSATSAITLRMPTASNLYINNNAGGTMIECRASAGFSVFTSQQGNLTINVNLNGSANATTLNLGSDMDELGNLIISNGSCDLTMTHGTSGSLSVFPPTTFSSNFTGNLITTLGNSLFYGNLKLSSGMAIPNTGFSNNQWILSDGISTWLTPPFYIDTSGVTINRAMAIGANWILQNNLTQGNAYGFFIRDASTTLNLNNFSWTTRDFSVNSLVTSTRVNFGTSGNITITGQPSTSGTTESFIFWGSNLGGLDGNVKFILTSNGNIGGTTRLSIPAAGNPALGELCNVAVNDSSANINILPRTDTVQIDGNVRNLNLSNMTHTQTFAPNAYIFGNLTIPASGGTIGSSANIVRMDARSNLLGITNTATIDTGNRLLDFPLYLQAGDGSGLTSNGSIKLLSNLNVVTTANANLRQLFSTANPLDLNDFTLTVGNFNMNSPTTARSIAFGTSGKIVYNTLNTSNFTIANSSNFSTTGNAQVFVSGTLVGTRTVEMGTQCGEANLFSWTINSTSGSANLFQATRDLTINASGTTIGTGTPTIFGNYIYRNGTFTAGTQIWVKTGASNTTVDTGNTIHPFNWRFSGGTTGNITLLNNLIMGGTTTSNRWIDLANGNVKLNGYAMYCGNFSISSNVYKNLDFTNGGNITLVANGQTILDFTGEATPNFNYTGNLQIIATSNGAAGTTRSINCGNIAESGTFNITAGAAANSIRIGTSFADNVTIAGNILGLNLTGWSGNRINWGNATCNFHGDISIPASGGNLIGIGNQWNITSTSATARTIDTGNRTLDWPWVFNGLGGTWTLQSNLILGSTRNSNLNAGTLDLNNWTHSCRALICNGTSNRSIAFGSSGNITLVLGSSTILEMRVATNFTYSGTPKIYCNWVSNTNSRQVLLGNSAGFTTGGVINKNNMFDVSINGTSGLIFAPGADSLAIQGQVRDLNLSNLTGNWTNQTVSVYGNFTLPASGGNANSGANIVTFAGYDGNYTISSNARVLDFPITFDGNGNFSIPVNLIVGTNTASSTRNLTLTTGNMSISNNIVVFCGQFISNGSNARNIDFVGTGSRLRLLGNNTTVWNSATGTNFTYSGTPYIESNYTSNVGTRTFNFGTLPENYTFDIVVPINTPGFALNTANDSINIAGNIKSLTLTSFVGTVTNAARNIFGNLTIPASNGTYTTGTAVTSFTATSGTRTINTNGRTLQFPFTFNGPGGTFVLDSNIVANTTTVLTLANGTVDFRQRDANTWANITIAGGATGNALITNLVSNRNFVHSNGNLTILSGTVNSSTTGTYTLNNASSTLNVSASFSTGAFTHTTGTIVL